MNNAAVNSGVQLSVQVPAFISVRYVARSETAGLHGNSIFNFFEESPFCSQRWLCHFRFPPGMNRIPVSLHLTNTSYFLGFFFFLTQNRYEMLSHCRFHLHFPND